MAWLNWLLKFTFICSQIFEVLLIVHNNEFQVAFAGRRPRPLIMIDQHELAKKLYRTAYHFQPEEKWINVPSGPLVHMGMYHLFYITHQNNGAIVWSHSISRDLINWKSLPIAITPKQNYDINGVWSGSSTILPDGRIVMLYTGIDREQKQVLNVAFPKTLSDPLLGSWNKAPQNPIIEPNIENHIPLFSFRDPTTAWIGRDREWRMVVGSQIDHFGMALLFKSKDFLNWKMVDHPLHYKDNNGMWESPDFYPVAKDGQIGVDTSSDNIRSENVKYVFKVGLAYIRKEYYTVGVYDKDKDTYVPDEDSIENAEFGLRYDYGKFYGSKTFYDSVKKRRILWGWVNESSPHEYDVKKGWSGVMGIPRVVTLDKSGNQLIQWPVEEVNQLRSYQVGISSKQVLGSGANMTISGITGVQADVEVSFEIPSKAFENAEVITPGHSAQHLCSAMGVMVAGTLGPFGMKVLATLDMKEYTAVFFRIYKTETNNSIVLMCSDQTRSSLDENHDKTTYGAFVDVDPVTEQLHLRILIDHSIVESFGGKGKSVITARVYPKKATCNPTNVYAFNNGDEDVIVTELRAWSMEKATVKL